MHWATKYIGKPWVSGGRGPEEFDCWGLVRWVFAEHYAISLPEFVGVDANDHLAVRRAMRGQEAAQATLWQDWEEVSAPTDGCAVAMGGLEMLHHVGVYIVAPEGPGVLHCRAVSGVVFQNVGHLKRECGFARMKFYKHASRH